MPDRDDIFLEVQDAQKPRDSQPIDGMWFPVRDFVESNIIGLSQSYQEFKWDFSQGQKDPDGGALVDIGIIIIDQFLKLLFIYDP